MKKEKTERKERKKQAREEKKRYNNKKTWELYRFFLSTCFQVLNFYIVKNSPMALGLNRSLNDSLYALWLRGVRVKISWSHAMSPYTFEKSLLTPFQKVLISCKAIDACQYLWPALHFYFAFGPRLSVPSILPFSPTNDD